MKLLSDIASMCVIICPIPILLPLLGLVRNLPSKVLVILLISPETFTSLAIRTSLYSNI